MCDIGCVPWCRMEFGYKRRPLRVEWAKVGTVCGSSGPVDQPAVKQNSCCALMFVQHPC